MSKDYLNFSKKTSSFYSQISFRTVKDMINFVSNNESTDGVVFALKIFTYISAMYYIDKLSGIYMIIFSILILITLAISNSFYYKNLKQLNDEFLEIKSYVADTFSGIQEIKLFNAKKAEFENYKKRTNYYWKKTKSVYIIDQILSNFSRNLFSMIFYFLVIKQGINLKDPGSFFALTNLFLLLRYQLFTSLGVWDNIRTAVISAKQLEENVG